MDRIQLKEIYARLSEYGGKTVTVAGWARTIRDSKAFGFIELNDGSCFKNTQIVFERTKSDYVLMLLQCALGIVAIIGPNILQKRHNFIIPSKMMVLYTLFLYGAIFLGEVMAFYYNVPHWDTFLHGLSGAMLGALGYTVISVLNRSDSVPVNLSPLFVAFFTFCFAMTMGMIWEIYEFSVDSLFGTNMQKFAFEDGTGKIGQAALMDTMKDLIVDTIGALTMSIIGYISLKHKTGLVDKLIFKSHKQKAETEE